MTERVPLLLDVDTGIDDAAAIALAWHSPETRLLSVSTVAGNTTIGNATRNTLDVLDLLGASSVEVYQGASRPLVRERSRASRRQASAAGRSFSAWCARACCSSTATSSRCRPASA